MRKTKEEFSAEQEEDLLYLLRTRYGGDSERMKAVWGFEGECAPEEVVVPGIEELKADTYRQLKGAIGKTADPQKLANTLKILEDMKDRDEGKDLEEKAKGIAESIASLADAAPPQGLADISLEPVVSEHMKMPRRRREKKPSKEVNGLDENSDSPREGLGGAGDQAQEPGEGILPESGEARERTRPTAQD